MRFRYLVSIILVIVFLCSVFMGAAPQQKVPVLLYHHLLTDEENQFFRNSCTITPDDFEQQMAYLYNEGYSTITIRQLNDFIYSKTPVPEKSIMITFDDGYLSNYKYAYDILKKYNFTAVLYVVTGTINLTPQPFNANELTMISYPEMEAMKDVFEFGSHTHNMHKKDDNGVPYIISMPIDEVRYDFEQSFNCPNIGRTFAYPYGMYNSTDMNILKSLDCTFAFNSSNDAYVTSTSNPYKLPRFSVHRDMPLEKFKAVFEKSK